MIMTTAHKDRGHILLLSLIFLGIFVTVSTALLSYITSSLRAERAALASAQALALAEGAIDKAVALINEDLSYSGETDTPLGNGTFSISVENVDSSTKRVVATAFVPDSANPIATKIIKSNIAISSDIISFHYGIQAGDGGFTLANSSSIRGNAFSTGPVIGSGGNYVYGDVVSSGPSGLVYGIHATSSVYAHTIGAAGTPTTIDKNAYYTTKTNTTVSGTSYPGSPDQESVGLPISDEQIAEWEAIAEAGGTAVCSGSSYNISSGSVTLGPIKIPCDLNISGSSVVTVNGHIWVTGNITVQNTAIVKMDPSLGSQNVAIIADNPSDQLNSSIITVKNTVQFQNSGTAGSFVFLISQNRSAESGGSVAAFSLTNSASALVAYAAHGLIPLENSVALKEATAYKISLKNSAQVIYDTGLPSAVFESGPGGSWGVAAGTYAIIR